jgi:hypothetical protein
MLEEADDPSLQQEQAPNPLAEKAREELAQKPKRLDRRESGTILEHKSAGFAGFAAKNTAADGVATAGGEGVAPQGAFLRYCCQLFSIFYVAHGFVGAQGGARVCTFLSAQRDVCR